MASTLALSQSIFQSLTSGNGKNRRKEGRLSGLPFPLGMVRHTSLTHCREGFARRRGGVIYPSPQEAWSDPGYTPCISFSAYSSRLVILTWLYRSGNLRNFFFLNSEVCTIANYFIPSPDSDIPYLLSKELGGAGAPDGKRQQHKP